MLDKKPEALQLRSLEAQAQVAAAWDRMLTSCRALAAQAAAVDPVRIATAMEINGRLQVPLPEAKLFAPFRVGEVGLRAVKQILHAGSIDSVAVLPCASYPTTLFDRAGTRGGVRDDIRAPCGPSSPTLGPHIRRGGLINW
jgi:hypothetical protein